MFRDVLDRKEAFGDNNSFNNNNNKSKLKNRWAYKPEMTVISDFVRVSSF